MGAPLMLSVSGCRGIVGESLTPDLAARYASCVAGWLRERAGREPRIVFGRDGRAGGEALRLAALSGLVGSGAKVVDLGVAMTPTVGVAVDHHGADGGLILTASHNPAEWNGLKTLVAKPGGARAPSAPEASALVGRFGEGRTAWVGAGAQGELNHDASADHAHVARVLDALGEVAAIDAVRARGFRVVVDSVNSSGANGARLLLDALGCEVDHAHADGSGVFPHTPEPTEENLRGLCALVREQGADIGFAQDPDADRLAIVDEKGAYIGEERTLALAALAVLPGAGAGARAAANLSTSRMIDDVAARCGAEVIRAAVGEANVVEAMERAGCVIGGEGNGGVIWPAVCMVRDSLSAMALTLALLVREAAPLSRVVSGMGGYEIVKRKLPIEGIDAGAALERVARAFADARIDLQDGVRVDLDDEGAWVHVRASNTEPILRLIGEARRRDRAQALLDEAARAVAG